MKKYPLVWAHRGASARMPENTIPSFREAIRAKADGIELDIQLTKDKRIVVCHDETVDRTSDGSGWIKDLTFDRLRAMNFNQKDSSLGPVPIPLMEEVLDLMADTGMIINIELKTGIVFYDGIEQMILDLVERKNMKDKVIYSSFNHYSMLKVKDLEPEAYTAFLYEDGPIGMPAYAKKHNMNAIHPALYNIQYPGVVAEAHELGLDVNVWTVDEKEHLEICAAMGIDAVFTNDPEQTRKIFEKLP